MPLVTKRLKVTGIVGEHKPLPKSHSRYGAVSGLGAMSGGRVPTPTKAEVDEVVRQAREFRTSAGRKRTVTRGEAKWAAESDLYRQARDRDEEFHQRLRRSNRGPYRISKRRVAPSAVGKRLVDEERRTSIPRLLATGAGMGAIAWGGSRSKVLGRGLRLGATHPDIKVGLRRAFHTAELARSSTERVTSPLGAAAGRGYGHLPANVRASLDNVPPSLRPATSALVGAIVVENSRPVRRTTYRPVVID